MREVICKGKMCLSVSTGNARCQAFALKFACVCVWTCMCVLAYLQGKGREAVNFGKCHPHTHFSSPLETGRQIGVKSTQVIYPHRDSDYLSLSLYFYPFLRFLISQSLWNLLLRENRRSNLQSQVLFTERAWQVWCELYSVIASSVLSQISKHWEREKEGERETGRGVVPVGDPLHSAPVLLWQDRH